MFLERLIVVGTDGSEGGRQALAWALEHAGRTGATVQVVSAYAGSAPRPAAIATARNHAEVTQLRDVAAVLATIGTPPVLAREVVLGDAVAVLTGAAAEADMLVVGSHGRSHVRTALMGSVAAACIRAGTCPVLLVPTARVATRQREVVTRVRRL